VDVIGSMGGIGDAAVHPMRALITTLAIAVAAALTACTGTPGPQTTESTAASTTPAMTPATPTASAVTSPTTGRETASASPSPTEGGPLGDAADCENEELGYEVDYPGDWWANDRIEPDDESLTPIPACQFFAPTEVELQPNAGLPNGIAIRFETPDQEIDAGGGTVLSEDETTVDGRDARVIETEPEPQAGFVPEGSHLYRYIVELDGGGQLVATTDDILQDEARYAESKAMLDAMMDTLEIED
jgi:hypothetical protein